MIARAKNKALLAFITLVSLIFLSGCQTTGGGQGDVDPRLTQGDSAKFFTKAGAQACAVGALTGVLACALTHSSNKAACMAIAAVAGCTVGAGGAYVLDQRRAKYSNNEQRIQSFIEDVQKDNDNLKVRINEVNVVLRENQQTLRQLQQQIATKQIDQKKAQSELNRIKANKAYLEKELANINARIDGFQDIIEKERAVGADVRPLQAKLDGLVRDRDLMQRNVDSALALSSSIKVTG